MSQLYFRQHKNFLQEEGGWATLSDGQAYSWLSVQEHYGSVEGTICSAGDEVGLAACRVNTLNPVPSGPLQPVLSLYSSSHLSGSFDDVRSNLSCGIVGSVC